MLIFRVKPRVSRGAKQARSKANELAEYTMLIDSHAHIHFKDFAGEIPQILARAKEAGVGYIINIGTDIPSSQQVIAMAEEHPQVFATVGIHPHEVAVASEAELATLKKLASHERVMAIGEIGLDYHYTHSPKEVQQAWLAKQIHLALELNLPIIIHCREAFEDCIRILDEEGGWSCGGVFHCYTGDLRSAQTIMKKGFFISFSGIITFDKAKELQEVARWVPRDHYLIETDSPYLAPAPYRGKRNEPAYVRHVAERLAEIKGLQLSDVERITAKNAVDLFGLPITLPDDAPKIAYRIRNSLYLNITNQCTLACTFCPKFDDWMVKGHCLELDHEPTEAEILDAVGDPSRYQEIVFCGFGEPTLRLELLLSLARTFKEKGAKHIRLDTEGLGNLVNDRNIIPDLAQVLDSISVSLNAPDPKTYARLCPSRYGEAAYTAVVDFIKESKQYIPNVTATVVGLPNLDSEACRKIAEEELGVKFRLRPYDEVG